MKKNNKHLQQKKVKSENMYCVYILRTCANTLYIGQTNNLAKRVKEHHSKTSKSAKYMRSFSSFELVYTEAYASRTEAMKREYELKQWTKAKKEALITGKGVTQRNKFSKD